MPSDPLANVDPLIIDFDGDGLELMSVAESSVFLRPGDAPFAMRVGWAHPDEAILIRDANANGTAETGEIVGFTSGNAWADLAAMAGDVTLDASDAAWSELRAWRDLDGDGTYEPGELLSMEQAGIASISLSWTPLSTTVAGNQVYGQTTIAMDDETTRDTYSVFFAANPMDTHYVGAVSVEDWFHVLDLADVRGAGSMADLRIAAALNDGLRPWVNEITWGAVTGDRDPDQLLANALRWTDGLLVRWADTEELNPAARGEFGDARKLAAMERYTASPFVQEGGVTNPTVTAGSALDIAWAGFVKDVAVRLLVQGGLAQHLGDTHYDIRTDSIVSTHSVAHAVATFAEMGEDRTTLRDKANYWAGALAVLDALQAASTNPDPDYAANVEAALADAGLGGFAHVLRNPVFLAEGVWNPGWAWEGFYYHRASGDAFIVGGDDGHAMSVNVGDHIVLTGAGNDVFRPAEGSNLIDLGGGTNRLTYDLLDQTRGNVSMTIDMETGIALKHTGDVDRFVNVQELYGTRMADTITGSQRGEVIVGIGVGDAMEVIDGKGGDDTIVGFDAHNPWLGHGLLNARGGDGDDSIVGTDGAFNALFGDDGDDVIDGRAGFDWIRGGLGADTLTGGAGADAFRYGSPDEGGDVITDFTSEDLIWLDSHGFGGLRLGYLDTALPTEDGQARFVSGAGAVATGNGWQIVHDATTGEVRFDADGAGSGASVLIATLQPWSTLTASQVAVMNSVWHENMAPGALLGTAGSDLILGTAGDDHISGMNGGEDTLEGGDGDDFMSLSAMLPIENTAFGGEANGGAGNDTIHGKEGWSRLRGGDGDDVIHGYGSWDWIWGGMGEDTIAGGGFPDAIRYDSPDEGGDLVLGFSSEDVIWLDPVGFGVAQGQLDQAAPTSDDKARFVSGAGAVADGEGWQVVFDTTTRKLWFDPDGVGSSEAKFLLRVTDDATITANQIGFQNW
ncbi:hypothetical protein DFH01_09765 [Falsiroseomonas bella]|uniref:Calcium-binding protein n=1 Tax=Falsiroseomonas bella TaxID=2184016 RepID=A0A317FDH8_9PROT|nr:hypothetical protein DFH01_09765 [Falsiroseomonas bella]